MGGRIVIGCLLILLCWCGAAGAEPAVISPLPPSVPEGQPLRIRITWNGGAEGVTVHSAQLRLVVSDCIDAVIGSQFDVRLLGLSEDALAYGRTGTSAVWSLAPGVSLVVPPGGLLAIDILIPTVGPGMVECLVTTAVADGSDLVTVEYEATVRVDEVWVSDRMSVPDATDQIDEELEVQYGDVVWHVNTDHEVRSLVVVDGVLIVAVGDDEHCRLLIVDGDQERDVTPADSRLCLPIVRSNAVAAVVVDDRGHVAVREWRGGSNWVAVSPSSLSGEITGVGSYHSMVYVIADGQLWLVDKGGWRRILTPYPVKTGAVSGNLLCVGGDGGIGFIAGRQIVGWFPGEIDRLVVSGNGLLAVDKQGQWWGVGSDQLTDVAKPGWGEIPVVWGGGRYIYYTRSGKTGIDVYQVYAGVPIRLVFGPDNGQVIVGERMLPARVVMVDGTIYVSVRPLVTAVGGFVHWDEGMVVCAVGGRTVKITAGSSVLVVDGQEVLLGSAPVVVDGRMMVPVRDVMEALQVEVLWRANDMAVELRP